MEEAEKKLKEEVKKKSEKGSKRKVKAETERKSKEGVKQKCEEGAEIKEKEEAEMNEKENAKLEEEIEKAESLKIKEEPEEVKRENFKEGEVASENQRIEKEKGGEAVEATKHVCENNSMENIQDCPTNKHETKSGDIANVTTDEVLMNGKLKEDDGEEMSKLASKSSGIEQGAAPIEKFEVVTVITNENNADEGCQLRRRATTSRQIDLKSLEQTKCVDEKGNTPKRASTSHTFHISRVPEKSYSRPTRTGSGSGSRRRRSSSSHFPAHDLVSVLANITIRYQVKKRLIDMTMNTLDYSRRSRLVGTATAGLK